MKKPQHPNSLANLRPPWKPGDVANPKGRPKRKTLSEYAAEQLEQVVDKKTGKTKGEEIVESWLANCVVTPALMIELLARTEGKVPNAVNVQNDGQIRVVIVHEGEDADRSTD